jgi:hypothetical protein
MAYIGKTPTIGNFQVCDAISVVNGQAAYTMQVGSVNVSPESANHMLVSLNGILQKPGSSFTVSSSTITFASNLVTGDVIDFIQILGNVLDLGVPSDSTVSLAKLTATGTKSSSTFLRGDNTFDTPPLGGITMGEQWRLTTTKTSNGVLDANLEVNDTSGYGSLGTGMSESSGIFTFPSTGIYMIIANGIFIGASENAMGLFIDVTTNNSSYTIIAEAYDGQRNSTNTYASGMCQTLIDVTDTSNVKVRFQANTLSGGSGLQGGTSSNLTSFMFVRLGDT